MTELLRVNDILVFNGDNHSERILWIGDNYSYANTINMESSVLQINIRDIKDIENMLEEGTVYIDNERYSIRIISRENLSEKEAEILERAWIVISSIANIENEPAIFASRARTEIIGRAISEFNVSKAYIYKYLKKFWKGGKTKYSLLSDLWRCGSKGTSRKSEKKLGRPHIRSRTDPEKAGVNLTEKDKVNFMSGLKKYGKERVPVSLKKIYKLIVLEYYTNIVIVDGEMKRKAKEVWEYPTEYQFRNWYYREYERNVERELIRKYGKKDYMANRSSRISNAKYWSFGPGFRFEIDATRPAVHLVSRVIKSKRIGKPTVYFVVDTFSTLIVGVYIGLDNPSWECAASALYNCIEDKVEYCKSFEIEISKEQWPNSTLPRKLLADKGEFGGDLPLTFAEGLNIEIENTRSGMGRDKGTVEGQFRKSESEYKPLLHGAVFPNMSKSEYDKAIGEAQMNIAEFTRIVLHTVIKHNTSYIENYPVTQEMLDDNVVATPANIWSWGIKKYASNISIQNHIQVKLSLMRVGTAKVTDRGIIFIRRRYDCNIAHKERWYVTARNKGTWDIPNKV